MAAWGERWRVRTARTHRYAQPHGATACTEPQRPVAVHPASEGGAGKHSESGPDSRPDDRDDLRGKNIARLAYWQMHRDAQVSTAPKIMHVRQGMREREKARDGCKLTASTHGTGIGQGKLHCRASRGKLGVRTFRERLSTYGKWVLSVT